MFLLAALAAVSAMETAALITSAAAFLTAATAAWTATRKEKP